MEVLMNGRMANSIQSWQYSLFTYNRLGHFLFV